jgi:hypothetical protein
MNAPQRKYVSEWTLVVTVLAAALGRQQEFEGMGPPVDYDCHLYIVSKRPRMSVDPATVVITDSAVSLSLRLNPGLAGRRIFHDQFGGFRGDGAHAFDEGA